MVTVIELWRVRKSQWGRHNGPDKTYSRRNCRRGLASEESCVFSPFKTCSERSFSRGLLGLTSAHIPHFFWGEALSGSPSSKPSRRKCKEIKSRKIYFLIYKRIFPFQMGLLQDIWNYIQHRVDHENLCSTLCSSVHSHSTFHIPLYHTYLTTLKLFLYACSTGEKFLTGRGALLFFSVSLVPYTFSGTLWIFYEYLLNWARLKYEG